MPYIDWLGKDDVVHHHKEIAYKTIDCQEVVGDEESENMIIKGDNLLALKSLLPYYAGAVKMIYIDPPYNTGETKWVYGDNMDSPLIKKWLDDTVDSEDLSRSDKWLCMMYPRIKLLKELLQDKGIIFISIDDAEVGHLRVMCDEIFGGENFVSNFIWEKRTNRENRKVISQRHDHILCYVKSDNKKDIIKQLPMDGKALASYKNPDNDERGPWKSDPATAQAGHGTDSQFYTLIAQNGKEHSLPGGRCWLYTKEVFAQMIDENRIWFGKDGNGVPRVKTYLYAKERGLTPESIFFAKDASTNEGAKNKLKEIFNGKSNFETPKPVELIKHILKISTSKDDIILDSFAGSGTTAHAVIEQNRADGGNRKFILIETLDYAKEITAERVKRVQQGYAFKGKDKTVLFEKKLTTTQVLNAKGMEKLSIEVNALIETKKDDYSKIEKTFKENVLKVVGIKEIESFKEGLGGGFKYCELGVEIFDESGELNPKLSFDDIAKHIYFVEFKQPRGKTKSKEPFVGTYKQKHLYFYEKQFRVTQLKALIATYEKYKQLIVYTRRCSISADELKKHRVTVRYIPYDIKDN